MHPQDNAEATVVPTAATTWSASSSSTVGEATRIDGHQHLPARPIPQRGLDKFLHHAFPLYTFLFFIVAFPLAIWGTVITFRDQLHGASYNNCEARRNANSTSLDSSSERFFLIDIAAATDLTFTDAKILDLAWDALAGQLVGRIIHGAALYSLTARCLTWLEENWAVVPYGVHVDVLFSPGTPTALWATLRMVLLEKPKVVEVTLAAIWMFLSTAYALALPTLWGAATGYMQPSSPAFQVGNGSWVSEASDALSFCWVTNAGDFVPDAAGVITGGPKWNEFDLQFTDIGIPKTEVEWEDKSRFGFEWYLGGQSYNETGVFPTASEAWRNMYAYALTKSTILNFYRPELTSLFPNRDMGWPVLGPAINHEHPIADWKHLWDAEIQEPCWISPDDSGHTFSPDCASAANATTASDIGDSGDAIRITSLFPTILGWHTAGVGQLTAENLTLSPVSGSFSDALSVPFGLNRSIYAEQFWLDESLATSGQTLAPGTVPYNSTLWWNSERYELAAPFLDIGAGRAASGGPGSEALAANCSSWIWATLPVCLCVGEGDTSPVTMDLTDDRNLSCVVESGYTWGFASHMTMIAVLLELVWLFGCAVLWWASAEGGPRGKGGSQLVRLWRPNTGTVRNVIDVAGAMERDLGRKTGTYNEKELREVLKRCGKLAFVIEEDDGDDEDQTTSGSEKGKGKEGQTGHTPDGLEDRDQENGSQGKAGMIVLRSEPSGVRQRRKIDLDLKRSYG